MPAAVGAVVGAVAKGIGLLVTAYQTAGPIIQGAIKIAAIIGASQLTNKLFGPKAPDGPGLQPKSLMNRSSIAFRQIVYGQAAISGPIYFNNISGTDNEYLWFGISLCEDESSDLVSVWIDDIVVPKADIDWTAGTGSSDGTGTGDVSTADLIGQNSTKAAAIFYYLGEANQPVCGALDTAFATIDSSHRGRGVTHIVCRLLFNEDTEEIWENGAPQNIKAVIKGRKVYDPRLDSTNGGSGAQRYNDSSTWTYSDNPALCAANYMMEFMGVDPATRIDWASFTNAASDCDVLVSIPSSSEKRFTCNGVLSLGQSHRQNLEYILSSCNGKIAYSQGKWRMRASVWQDSSLTLTEGHLVGDLDIRAAAPKSDRFNRVRGFFTDPDRNYELAEFPHVASSTYEARDNNTVIPFDLELPMTNTKTMAQRVAKRVLEQGNNQTIVSMKTNLVGAQILIGDVITLDLPSLGWTSSYNLLGYTEDISNAYWTKTGGAIIESDERSPFATSCEIFAESLQDTSHYIEATVAGDPNVTSTFSIYLKPNDSEVVDIRLINDSASTSYVYARCDIRNGTVVTTGAANNGQFVNAGVDKAGNGWYRCWIAGIPDTTSSASDGIVARVQTYYASAVADTATSQIYFPNAMVVGTQVKDGGFYVTGAQLEYKSYPTVYLEQSGAAASTSPKTFRVIEWAQNPDFSFSIVAKEDYEARYTDPLVGDYDTEAVVNITPPNKSLAAPTGLTATQVSSGIRLDWTSPATKVHDYVDVYASTDDQWSNATKVARVRADTYTHVLDASVSRWYWVRAVKLPNTESVRFPNSATSTITATSGGLGGSGINPIGATIGDTVSDPADAEVGFRINSDGRVLTRSGDGSFFSSIGNWLSTGVNSDFEVLLTDEVFLEGSTAVTGSATGTWLGLGSTRTWTLTATTIGQTTTVSYTVKWRKASNNQIVGESTLTLSAQVE